MDKNAKTILVGGLDAATDRIEIPVVGWSGADQGALSFESLRKDAERYRWFRNHSLQIVHSSTGPWVHNLDKVIDEAMAEVDVFDVPLMCRQRMAAEGLPYPRSSCYSCGQFSPKSRECDELIAARLKEGK